MAELQPLALVDHHALQVVHLGTALAVLHAQLLGKRYPKIQFLLHEGLRVDAEALEVNEEDFGEVANHDLLGGDLARQARLTHQLVVLVQQLLEAEPPHALDKRRVSFNVQAQVEEGLLAPRRCLTADARHDVEQPALEELLHEGGRRFRLILMRLNEVFMDFVEQPVDKLVGIMVLIVVKNRI